MKKIYPLVSLTLLFSVLLAACGDSTATTVPAPTTAPAVTTAAATTAPAATTAAATTAVTTAAATTLAATTAAATTAAGTTSAAGTSAAGDLSFTDMTGYNGKLTKPAQKIICMWTDCFDMLKELGLEPMAVDTSVYKILLASADVYPIVDKNKTYREVGGTFTEPDIEDILSLQPDLIIGLAPQNIAIREALPNIPLFMVKSPTYQQMLDNLRTIGRLTGKSAEAEKAVAKFESKLAAYKAKSPRDKQVMLINTQDGITFRVYTNKYLNCNLLNEVAKCTWASSSEFKEPQPGILNYSFEQILAANPEVLLSYVYPGQEGAPQILKNSQLWNELKAVKNKQVFEINAAVAQPGGTLGLGILLDQTMTALYPDVFPAPLN